MITIIVTIEILKVDVNIQSIFIINILIKSNEGGDVGRCMEEKTRGKRGLLVNWPLVISVKSIEFIIFTLKEFYVGRQHK